jgi:hypothetical protein
VEVPPEISAAVERVFPAVERMAGGRFPNWRPGPDMEARGLLYLDEFSLSEAQVAAIAEAAAELDEQACYLSYVERYDDPATQDFELESLSIDRYRELRPDFNLDHVVVSRRGQWGIYVDNDGVAVAAGPEEFITSLYRTLPSAKEQATRYASEILSTDLPGLHTWLVDLLSGVLGPDDAAAVLASARGH